MADFVINGEKSFPIAVSIGQYLRVKCTAASTDQGVPLVTLAGVADVTIGTTTRSAVVGTGPLGQTINGSVSVRLASAQGTMIGTLDGGDVAIQAPVYSAASGKVSGTNATTSILLGYSLTTATEDGDFIEYLPV